MELIAYFPKRKKRRAEALEAIYKEITKRVNADVEKTVRVMLSKHAKDMVRALGGR